VASSGFSVSTVSFDEAPSSVNPLPYTSRHLAVEGMRVDSNGKLNMLSLNFNGPGDVRIFDSENNFPVRTSFDSDQQYSRSLAFDSSGTMIVSGTNGNINDSGWIRGYDSSGALAYNINVALQKNLWVDSGSGSFPIV
jgi:hypothetical protein